MSLTDISSIRETIDTWFITRKQQACLEFIGSGMESTSSDE
jgi:hypothetical protein